MNIIIFGAGEDTKKAIPFLEKEHKILFLCDSDKGKQGSAVDKYPVKSPDEMHKFDCMVVVTSGKFGFEIVKQALQSGVSGERIYYCRLFQTDARPEYELCPVFTEKLGNTGIPLVRYDLHHAEECRTGRKKVLVFCTFFSTYTKQLIENMAARYADIEFSLLTRTRKYREEIVGDSVKHIYYFRTMADLNTILGQLPEYDAMQLLWIEWEWAYFYRVIREKAGRLNLNVGGSDFYREEKDGREFRRQLIDCADQITAETETTVQEFGAYYGEAKGKLHLLPFGIEVLEWIDRSKNRKKSDIKEKLHIPDSRIVVTCGHNAIAEHRHMEIINAAERLPLKMKQQTVFVFPMTYPQGAGDYIKAVRRRLEESGLAFVILTDFMDYNGMAEYALVSDIMIHVQTTDQLSSTMLEEMYAGSVVIAGKWLPYGGLHKKGIFFLDVENLQKITRTLGEVIDNLDEYKEKCKGNRQIVRKCSSWEELAPGWRALWF